MLPFQCLPEVPEFKVFKKIPHQATHSKNLLFKKFAYGGDIYSWEAGKCEFMEKWKLVKLHLIYDEVL